MMKRTLIVLCVLAALVPFRSVSAQVAGQTTLGVTVEEMKLVVLGSSARRDLLDHPVFNDKNERLGTIDDIIISPDRTASWAIIGVGGFLGIGKRDVAIPMDHIKLVNKRLELPGATKEVVKAMPPFEYAK